MAIDLVTKFKEQVDEQFTEQSKSELFTNNDYDFTGANTIKIYSVKTSSMNDYDREGTGEEISRYGEIQGLDATIIEYKLEKDRSFTFAIDKLDEDETQRVLQGATALARQQREVIIPEVDTFTILRMSEKAGTIQKATELTKDNIYQEILKAQEVLDEKLIPETERTLIVSTKVHNLLKLSGFLRDNTIAQDMLIKGVVGVVDGLNVVKVSKGRLPGDFGFMIAHKSATVRPVKLEEFKIHENPPFISGSLVEGRVNYGAFVLENKKYGIYYQKANA
ncbi:hypothetical protein ABGF48_07505 [Helcococcus bovis]|uniref:hypothetical protein n=1 Tax=Helcococcus bovis TaxID=3153252 RepID=UPI0038B6ED59